MYYLYLKVFIDTFQINILNRIISSMTHTNLIMRLFSVLMSAEHFRILMQYPHKFIYILLTNMLFT